MSLSGIVSSAINKVEQVTNVDVNSDGAIGSVPFSTGTTSAGGYMVQGGGSPGEPTGGSLLKKMLVGGVVGAGVGFAASFTPALGLITALGPAGWAAKGIMTAAGAAIGAIGGLAVHFISKHKQNLAMQAQAQATTPSAMAPTTVTKGVTLRANARGTFARQLQENLATLGLYKGKMTRMYDAATQAAVRKYEVMKGVQPTGQATPELRAAVAQDVKLVKQYA